MFISTTIFLIIIYYLHIFTLVLANGFCHINTATTVDKQMLLASTSDRINYNVETMIKKQALRSGISPSLIKGCVESKKNEIQKTSYLRQWQDYNNKVNKQTTLIKRLRTNNK